MFAIVESVSCPAPESVGRASMLASYRPVMRRKHTKGIEVQSQENRKR